MAFMGLFSGPMSRQKRSWMSFLRNSNISVKTFQNQDCDKWHTAIEFMKIASGENLKILGEA